MAKRLSKTMPERNGIFIVLEGADGSGKSTQFRLLSERLKAVGYDVEVFKFPQYDQPSSHFIKKYLNGAYGPASSVNPYTASLFYALDRYEAAPDIRKALAEGKIVLADRFVGSNMAHQGGKFTNSGEQRGFFIWDDGLEYELLGIPRPNTNIFLRVPVEIAQKLMHKDNRSNRNYTTETHDEHEKDTEHLRRSIETYDTLCRLFPKDFQSIDCTQNGKMLSIAEINDKIWAILKPILPSAAPHKARDVVVQLNENTEQTHFAQKEETSKEPQSNTQNSSGADQFSTVIKKVSLLAIDYLRATDNINIEVESVEWPAGDQFNYYAQARLPKKIAGVYKKSLQDQIELFKQMQATAAKLLGKSKTSSQLSEALAVVTPLAALATVRISGDAEAIKALTVSLQNNPLDEVRWLGKQLYAAGVNSNSRVFNTPQAGREEFSNSEVPLGEAIAKLAAGRMPKNSSANPEEVALLEAWPRNEFDVLIDALYPYSTSSRKDIAAELLNWPYEQKKEALSAALAQENSPVLQQVRYLWNIICDRSAFAKLKDTIQLQELKIQPPGPHYGYEVPAILEQAGLDGLFMECFDESLKLFTGLRTAGLEDIAAYATLMGHKNRWQFRTNGELFGSINAQLKSMQEKINETHPLIGEFISISSKKADTGTKPASASGSRKTGAAKRPQRHASRKRTRKSKKK